MSEKTLHIRFTGGITGQHLELFDMQGSTVLQKRLGTGTHLTRSANLPAGVYVVRITHSKGVHTEKVLIGR